MTVAIIWLLMDAFTIVTLFMDSAPHVEYSDVVQCGVYVDIKNYPTDGLATTSDSISLLRSPNYKQIQQMMLIRNGFHLIVLSIGEIMYVYMDYLLVIA